MRGWRQEPIRHSLASYGMATKFHSDIHLDDIHHPFNNSKWINGMYVRDDVPKDGKSFDFDIVTKGDDILRHEPSSLSYNDNNMLYGMLRFPLIDDDDDDKKRDVMEKLKELSTDEHIDYEMKPMKALRSGTQIINYSDYTHIAPHIIIRNQHVSPKYLYDKMEEMMIVVEMVMEEYK